MHHRQIVIETLPTSNVVIGHHHSFSTYHLYNWYKWSKEGEKIPAIVVGTDDAGIFATNIFSDLITLPDAMEATFMQLKDSILGIASIAIIGPVTEEFIFRQATLGGMLRNGIRPIYAVLLSALLFGVIHLNWAQILPAFSIGIMLGIIYLKTGNIILCTIIHIINNSIAVAQMIVLGENTKDFKLTDALGGYTVAMPLMVACFALSALLLVKLWRRE